MRKIYIEKGKKYNRIAIKDNNILTECLIEEASDKPKAGEIYKGIVKNIVPAIKCAFVDIGSAKNVYMYMDKKLGNMDIKKGQEILVQVTKEQTENKEAKVTPLFSIPGRYSIISNVNNEITFSKKITDESFKSKVMHNIKKPDNIGIKIRTCSLYADFDDINNEISSLIKCYNEINNKFQYSLKPAMLYSDNGIVGRVLRDYANDQDLNIIVDSEEHLRCINEYINNNTISCNVTLFSEKSSLFDYYELEKEILKLRDRRVNLKCGGYIVIDKTEAMYVIDVNSGRNTQSMHIENTVYKTNMEAAAEAARQIRLRNLCGIIIIDFIDMNNPDYKTSVMDTLKHGFYDDKVPVTIFPFTQLNLIQIARKKRGMSIIDFIEQKCNECKGHGTRLSYEYSCLTIRNSINRFEHDTCIEKYYIEINSQFKEKIMAKTADFINNINALDKEIFVKYKQQIDLPKVEPVIFENQVQKYKDFKIYG